MENGIPLLNYSLAVRGVFGRNRKEKFELVSLLKHVDPAAPKSLEELLPLVRQAVAKLKVKPGAVLILREEPVTVEVRDGYTSEMFEIFSERVLLREHLGSESVVGSVH